MTCPTQPSGSCLLGMPIGNIFGFMLAPYLVGRAGLTRISWISVAVLAALSLGVGYAATPFALMIVFAPFGSLPVAYRGHAERDGRTCRTHHSQTGHVALPRRMEHWLNSRTSGWRCVFTLSIPVLIQGAIAAVAGVAAAVVLARRLPYVARRAAIAGSARIPIRERIPKRALLLLCILPLGTLALEGIVRDWGAIFMRNDLDAAPFSSTLLLVVLSASMATVPSVRRFHSRAAGRARGGRRGRSSVQRRAPGRCRGAIDDGRPYRRRDHGRWRSVVYPVALSIAARRSDAPERDVATMSFICFVTLMASPAVVGFLSQAVGLRMTFAAFALLSLPALLLLR